MPAVRLVALVLLALLSRKGNMLYSQKLEVYSGPLSPAVEQAIIDIKQYFGVSDLKVLSFDRWHIVIPVTYEVSLPSNGAVNNIDIRPEEPMLIKLSLEDYPNFAPFILSDREDFPKSQLSHLYFTEESEPARLCMVRETPNEWFARIKMSDFLDVGQQWLYKAGTGLLNEDGDEFDPTRVEGNVLAKHVYKYDMLYEVVKGDQRLLPDYPMAILISGFAKASNKRPYYKTLMPVPFIVLPKVLEAVSEVYNPEKQNEGQNKENPLFSVLLWHPDNKVEELYLTKKPATFAHLKTFFSIRGIDIGNILATLEKQGVLIKLGVPIIYAMRRPNKVIGYNGEYEFFNFVLIMSQGGVAAIKDTDEVIIQSHIEPFGSMLAGYISGKPKSASTLYVGAGSLGSKMIMHDARAGNLHIGVQDNKPLLQHNLVRHELFAQHVGQNKAKAIVETIENFYTTESTDGLKAYEQSVVLMKADDWEPYKYLVDTTASRQVSNYLTLTDLPSQLRYIKSEIADEGKLGLLYAEGSDRNPRMDDLLYYTCYLATKDQKLANWRRADASRKIETLNIGLGCSSATSIMADDQISLHASAFSRTIVGLKHQDAIKSGIIFTCHAENASTGIVLSSNTFDVQPFEVLPCQSGSEWSVRMLSGTCERLLKLSNDHAPVETGGVLIGIANYKTKVVHVFDILTEPQDSQGTCTGFKRGIKGLPQEVEAIKNVTGDVIGYVGEWHTHPMDLKRLSQKDMETINDLKVLNRKVPIPTCALIVTTDEVLPFVFE